MILVPGGLFTFRLTPEAASCPGWKGDGTRCQSKIPRWQCASSSSHACESLSLLDVQACPRLLLTAAGAEPHKRKLFLSRMGQMVIKAEEDQMFFEMRHSTLERSIVRSELHKPSGSFCRVQLCLERFSSPTVGHKAAPIAGLLLAVIIIQSVQLGKDP